MIEGLKPYAEYKESGLPWLGRCPKNWSVRRTKILFHERVQKGFPNEPLLAATQTKGVVKKEDYETRTVTAQKDLHLLKLVEVGDYVISLRSFQGGIEVAHCRGIISPAYTVLKPRKTATSGYYSHFFKAKPFIDSLTLFVTGIREGQNIDYERLSRAQLPMPSPDEQAGIVRFLDHANRKIDGWVRAKRKLIGLLNRQKQAIIHRAVTRGLHADVPLKPSGIPWLGDIPKHWDMRKMKYLFTERVEKGFPNESLLAATQSMGVVSKETYGERTVMAMKDFHLLKLVKVGDFVISLRSFEGGIEACYCRGIISPAYTILIPKISAIRPYFRHFFKSPDFIASLTLYITGIREGQNIDYQRLSRCLLPLPPADECEAIANYLDVALKKQNTAIARTEREIALMQEYRTRLTADLVTGKLDVREAAAHLPAPPVEATAEPLADEPLEETEETE